MLPAKYFDELMSEQPPAPKPDRFADWKRETHFNKPDLPYFPPLDPPPPPHPWSMVVVPPPLDLASLEMRIAEEFSRLQIAKKLTLLHAGVDVGHPDGSRSVECTVGANEQAPNCRCVVNKVHFDMAIHSTLKDNVFKITITEYGKEKRTHSVKCDSKSLSKVVASLLELTNNLTKFVW